jgi:lysyl-tRNA synthetase class 2
LGGRISFENREQFRDGRFVLSGQGQTFRVQAAGVLETSEVVDGAQVAFDVAGVLRTGDLLSFDRVIAVDVVAVPRAQAPDIFSSAEMQRRWFEFQWDVVDGFSRAGMIQVQTPSMVICPGMEPALEPLSVSWKLNSKTQIHRFLPTSPELSLKKLLAAGYTDFFELRPCFRAEESSPLHATEFTMLEWYRAFAGTEILIQDLKDLFAFLHQKGWIHQAPEWTVVTMAQLFKTHVGLELTPETTREKLESALLRFGLQSEPSWSWDDCFHLLFLEKIERQLGQHGPTLVKDYPPSQAALARWTPEGWADRLELYWKGIEIANGFNELTDASLQRQRFEVEVQERADRGRTAVPMDEEFLKSLEAGLPPTAGMALGVERLFMACLDLRDIQQIKLFSTEFAENRK